MVRHGCAKQLLKRQHFARAPSRPRAFSCPQGGAIIVAVAIPLITALTPLLADLLDKIPDPDAKAKATAAANA